MLDPDPTNIREHLIEWMRDDVKDIDSIYHYLMVERGYEEIDIKRVQMNMEAQGELIDVTGDGYRFRIDSSALFTHELIQGEIMAARQIAQKQRSWKAISISRKTISQIVIGVVIGVTVYWLNRYFDLL